MAEERLFFALWPDELVRGELASVRRSLPDLKGRPVHPLDLHVTLVFLGAVDAPRRACAERAADVVRVLPFDLRLDQAGFWARPRVAWVGTGQTPPALCALVAGLQLGLRACGFEPERRPFSAHVTLARHARPLRARDLLAPVSWPVTDFALVASRPQRGPPHYDVLQRWPLRAPDSVLDRSPGRP